MVVLLIIDPYLVEVILLVIALGLFVTLAIWYKNREEAKSLQDKLKDAISARSSMVDEFLMRTQALIQARQDFEVRQREQRGETVPTPLVDTLREVPISPNTPEEYERIVERIKFSDEWREIYRVREPEMARLRRVIRLRSTLDRLPDKFSEFVHAVSRSLIAGLVSAFLILGYALLFALQRTDLQGILGIGIVSFPYYVWYGLLSTIRMDDLGEAISQLDSASTFEELEKSGSNLITKLQ
jgi:hypothetical protein